MSEPSTPLRLVIKKDHIDAYESTGRPFMFDVLGMNWDGVLLTDLSQLSDFALSGMPDELFPNTEGLDARASYSAALDAWDAWAIERVKALYGVVIDSTRIDLMALFNQIEAAPRVGGQPVFH